jgi:hypothetical protein
LALSLSAQIAQLVEHPLGKGEVDGSSPFLGSRVRKHVESGFCDVKPEVIPSFITQITVSHG